MEERKLCEDCGTKLAPDAKSCPTCGLNLETQADWEERVSEQMVEEAFPLPPEHARTGDVDERRSSRRTSFEYGGFWIRVVAYFIDTMITTAISYGFAFALAIAMGVLGTFDLDDLETGNVPGAFLVGYWLLSMALPWLYFALLESSSMQATLGKKLVNLRVTDLRGERIGFGRATGRYFGKILSGLVMGIGFLMVAFTQRKQGMHDMMANTLVVKG